ncbi:ribosomal protein S18-alanine N-acetyltransferase [Agarilytica rhodophyticola]|uniref:ribosomal protein S18-alanine N-acetyltransferase n=1 Tax=Agarilytica rhodophyticola TaxID=1737490 RepID=UPI000B340EE3|nr:ribosomal protein S18-alanine N-acetyltransferase [Agarilytica rhodophyticola]
MFELKDICFSFRLSDDGPFEIRNFNNEDLDTIVQLDRKASKTPWTLENYRDSVCSSHICVGVLYQQSWIAHAVFSIAADEAELLIIAVDPDYQKRGIAKKLLTFMESVLSDHANELFLEVRLTNSNAIYLYESLGFNCVGERRGYYPPQGNNKKREDALIYGKHLSS